MNIWKNFTQAFGLFSVFKAGEDLDREEGRQQAKDEVEQNQFCNKCGYPKSSAIHQKVCR